VLEELSVETVSGRFLSFESELGFWKYVFFPGGVGIMPKKRFVFTAPRKALNSQILTKNDCVCTLKNNPVLEPKHASGHQLLTVNQHTKKLQIVSSTSHKNINKGIFIIKQIIARLPAILRIQSCF